MIILGFDTSTPSTSVALRTGEGQFHSAADVRGKAQRPGHQQMLLELAHSLLEQANVDWRAIDRIAVGTGPGTYTGLRVGIAGARALAQSLGCQIVGVGTLEALAHAASRQSQRLLAVLDARRGEVFAAAYLSLPAERRGQDRSLLELAAPAALAPELVSEMLRQAEVVASQLPESPGRGRWLVLGDGLSALQAADELPLPALFCESPELNRVDARAICELAAAREGEDIQAVQALYCRRPDAELNLERRIQRPAGGEKRASQTNGRTSTGALE